MRRFRLQRDRDMSGLSGTGHVADGVDMEDGTAVVRWLGEWPTSVVHERGMESVQYLHGHAGATRIVYIDDENGMPFRFPGEMFHPQRIAPKPELALGPDRRRIVQHDGENADSIRHGWLNPDGTYTWDDGGPTA